MKRLIISLLFCLVTVYLSGQDYFMYVGGQKRTFEISETKMFVKSETLNASEMQRAGGENVRNVYELHNRLFMLDMQNASRELQQQWNAREDVIYTSPVFVDETGKEIGGLTNQILVRLKSAADEI